MLLGDALDIRWYARYSNEKTRVTNVHAGRLLLVVPRYDTGY
jgi:hypothetical protein